MGNPSCPCPMRGFRCALSQVFLFLSFPFCLGGPLLSPAVDQHGSQTASCSFPNARTVSSFPGSPIGYKKGPMTGRKTHDAPRRSSLRQLPSTNMSLSFLHPSFCQLSSVVSRRSVPMFISYELFNKCFSLYWGNPRQSHRKREPPAVVGSEYFNKISVSKYISL